MKSILSAACFIVAAFMALPASACMGRNFETSILFDKSPALPANAFAARVEITGRHDTYFTARVIEVLSDDEAPEQLLLDYFMITTCDREPKIGAFGVIVGDVLSRENGEVVVLPMRAPSQWQRDREVSKIAE